MVVYFADVVDADEKSTISLELLFFAGEVWMLPIAVAGLDLLVPLLMVSKQVLTAQDQKRRSVMRTGA